MVLVAMLVYCKVFVLVAKNLAFKYIYIYTYIWYTNSGKCKDVLVFLWFLNMLAVIALCVIMVNISG